MKTKEKKPTVKKETVVTTMRISKETRSRLMKLKYSLGHDNIDDVLVHLLNLEKKNS